MTTACKPIFLLAESQLLFRVDHGRPVAAAIRDAVGTSGVRSAYIGVANGDDPAFFSIFESAMDLVGARERRMIRADFAPQDVRYLGSADIILLGGGDPARGWRALEEGGVVPVLRDRYRAGAVLIGVSAGAALLGEKAFAAHDVTGSAPFEAVSVVPWIIDAHDEANGWRRLSHAVGVCRVPGVGLPAGAGVVCHPDMSVEPLRRAIVRVLPGDIVAPSLLMPEDHHPVSSLPPRSALPGS